MLPRGAQKPSQRASALGEPRRKRPRASCDAGEVEWFQGAPEPFRPCFFMFLFISFPSFCMDFLMSFNGFSMDFHGFSMFFSMAKKRFEVRAPRRQACGGAGGGGAPRVGGSAFGPQAAHRGPKAAQMPRRGTETQPKRLKSRRFRPFFERVRPFLALFEPFLSVLEPFFTRVHLFTAFFGVFSRRFWSLGRHTYSKELGRSARERGPLHGAARQPGASGVSHRPSSRSMRCRHQMVISCHE